MHRCVRYAASCVCASHVFSALNQYSFVTLTNEIKLTACVLIHYLA